MPEAGRASLERSCGPDRNDWMRFAPGCPGMERLEAFFTGYAYDPHRHDTYAIGYTVSGVQSFDCRGARRDSRQGEMMVIHPDERHNGRAGAEAGFHYRMLYLAPRLVREALAERASALPFVREVVVADRTLLRALAATLDDLDHPLEEMEADHAVLAVAEALLTLDPSARRGTRTPPVCADAVERARQFLDAHHDRAVGSGELERVSGLDRFTLARQFRAWLGTSPYRYLTLRRLDQARASMRSGLSLADAAFASGFADQSHMTRQFKRAYGLTPGRWRAMLGAG